MTTHHLLLKTSWDSRVVFLMTSPNRSSLNHESKNSWGGVESLFPPRHSWWMVSLRATKKITSKKRKHVHTYRFRPYIPPSSRFFKRWLEISYWWLFWVPLRELNGLVWDMDFQRFHSFEKSHKTYPISRVTSREPPEGGISWKSWAWMHDMFGNLQFPSFSESLAVSVRVEVPTCNQPQTPFAPTFQGFDGKLS